MLGACGITTENRTTENRTGESRTTDTRSASFTEKDEKLSFMTKYLVCFSEVEDVEYHIVYQDNSASQRIDVPGPSDWDIRAAIKVRPDDVHLWAEGYEEVGSHEINMLWWSELTTEEISWDASHEAGYYKRPGSRSYAVIFPDDGIVLKRLWTTSTPISPTPAPS
jgi:hypothetical protein